MSETTKNKFVTVEPTGDQEEVHGVLCLGACFAWKLLASTEPEMRAHIEAKLDAGEVAYAMPRYMTIKGVDAEDLELMPTYGFWRDEDTGELQAGIAVGTQGHARLYDAPEAEDEPIRFIHLGTVYIHDAEEMDAEYRPAEPLRVIKGGQE